jgi:hypothetical protein
VDALAMYGAVTGSAGLLGLAYQGWSAHTQVKDRLEFTIDYFLTRSDDPARSGELEAGVNLGVVNQSKHPIFIVGGGIEQQEPELGECSMFTQVVEVGPRRRYRGFWIAEDWIAQEDIRLDMPIRGYVSLEDGRTYYSDWQVIRPRRGEVQQGAPTPSAN